MSEFLTIGEVAEQAHVATSTIRYYERRGLLSPDARQSGRRRYRTETLRRLVFIGMLQDAGLALDDIDGILNAATVAEWKAIARRRLEILDEQITKLHHVREFLALALNCRFDQPRDGLQCDVRRDRPSPQPPELVRKSAPMINELVGQRDAPDRAP
jgi:DNA-binding transcriptional MerR regulator